MTYRELFYKATRLINKGNITLGEYEEMTKPLDREIEKQPILDKIRAEIHATAEMHEDGNYYLRDEWIDEIFDKYKAESEK